MGHLIILLVEIVLNIAVELFLPLLEFVVNCDFLEDALSLSCSATLLDHLIVAFTLWEVTEQKALDWLLAIFPAATAPLRNWAHNHHLTFVIDGDIGQAAVKKLLVFQVSSVTGFVRNVDFTHIFAIFVKKEQFGAL